MAFGFKLDNSTDTGIAGDGITGSRTVRISGTGEPGAVVSIMLWRADRGYLYNAGKIAVAADGTFTIDVPGVADGVFDVWGSSRLGSKSDLVVSSHAVTVDKTPPAAPVFDALPASTTDIHPVLTGRAEANSMVSIFVDGSGTPASTVSADASGRWSYQVGETLTAAQHQFSAKATDAAGNVSTASSTTTLTVTSAASGGASSPVSSAPVVVTMAAPVISAFASSLTNVVKPVVQGTAAAHATVTVYADGSSTALGTAKADASGRWSFTPATALADGQHSFQATAADRSGHVSSLSQAVALTIDHTPPATPILASFGTALTSIVTPLVQGTAEANASVTVFVDGKAAGTVKADSAGAWSFTTAALADGSHAFAARATDLAGNIGALSGSATLLVDHTAPLAPVVSGFGTSLTSNQKPNVAGSAEANATVTVYVDGTVLGTTKASVAGAWTFSPTVALSDGSHAFTARATDAAGNVSALSAATSLAIDHAAPGVPVIAAFTSAYTTSTTPVLHGSAEANATVNLYLDGAATAFGTAKADASGAWSLTPAAAIADGPHTFTARATDGAGNLSGLSSAVSVTIDHLAPLAPIIAAFGMPLSNDATPTLQGSAEAGSSVAIMVDGSTLPAATVVADAKGHWGLDLATLADGLHTFTATATDLAGNVSALSGSQSLTIDTHAPTALVSSLVVAGDNVISPTEAAASSIHVTGTLSQTLDAGDSLLLSIAGTTLTLGSANIAADHSFAVDVARPAQGWGAGVATAHVEDAAHNAGGVTSDAYAMGAAAPTPAPSSGFLLGVNIAGGEFGSLGGQYGWSYIYPSHSEIDYYDKKGMDVIRVPFSWERVQHSQFGELDATELSRLDDAVNYATSQGLKVVLDPHGYGAGFGSLIGTAGTSNAAFADFWGKMAAHYAGNTDVIFGLMNEPNSQDATGWLGSVNAAISAIRDAGATNEILVPGTHWDGAWTWTTTDNAAVIGTGVQDPLHNFAFEVHQYLDTWGSGTEQNVVSVDIGVQRLQAITQWAEQTGNKLFLGEFGVASDQTSLTALDKMLSYMEQHTGAWQGGTYWAGGAWWGDYMYSVEPNNGVDKAQMAVLQQHANQVV
jgi:aryl-phospho-beta-D-glucosidase BglC (GH1 family)